MKTARFRFYGELKDLLRAEHSSGLLLHEFRGRQSLKDRIETLGVPHTEVSLILREGEPVDFSYLVQSGDDLSVFPTWQTLKLPADLDLQPEPPKPIKFVLDAHLGKLASYLRMLGFDCLYSNDYDDAELAGVQKDEKRILLTRDRGLLKRSRVRWGCLLHSHEPRRQLREVMIRYDIAEEIDEFGRCPLCNGGLKEIAKEKIVHRLEPLTKEYFHFFKICSDCDKIYWRGSHFDRIQDLVESLKEEI